MAKTNKSKPKAVHTKSPNAKLNIYDEGDSVRSKRRTKTRNSGRSNKGK